MYTGQAEKFISAVFTFGDRANITASAAAVVKGYLTAPGGTNAATIEFAVVIPRNGILKNLYWSAEASTLVAAGNSITAYVKDPPTAPASAPTGLTVSWNGNVKAGSNSTNTVPVVAGDTVSIYFQLAKGSGILTRLRVSIELEVDSQYPNPWDLTGPIVSYMGGNVGVGTASPAGELHVKNAAAGGIAGVFETPSGKILSGRVGATEKFNVDAGGNIYASGKVGIGNSTPSTELDVNGTVQMVGMKLPTGAGNGLVLTSDGSGNGTWQLPGGGGGAVDGNGTPNAIAKFLGATTIDDSVIFQNGNNIGIGTDTPATTLEVNGAISGFGIVPIGSIIAWHKTFPNTPALPAGWVECNGKTLTDSASPFDGQIIPNLNGDGSGANSPNLSATQQMFLRGGTTSGTGQADAFQGHRHSITAWGNVAGSHCQEGSGFTINSTIVGDPITDGVIGNGTPRTADETRPVNMSVVWIMRVK